MNIETLIVWNGLKITVLLVSLVCFRIRQRIVNDKVVRKKVRY